MDPLRIALDSLGLGDAHVQERPWGLWVDWHRSAPTTLKAMVVRPGHRMSLQRHFERSEIWHVVSGNGEDQGVNPAKKLKPGDNHFVPVGVLHRLANTGSTPLIVVEAQSGNCREDDIERLEDDYKR